MAMSEISAKVRIDALTGLRFLAALAVYLHHHPKPSNMPTLLHTFLDSGYNGVTIFFVLSGFVIAWNYFDSLSRPTWQELVRFAIARLARVYPLYFLVLLYIWLERWTEQISGVYLHFLALQAWSPSVEFAYAFNGPGWSIGVEFFLYACFPLIAVAIAPLRRRTRALWLLAFGVTVSLVVLALYFHLSGRGALPGTDPESAHRWLYRTPLTRLGDFLLGVIAALLFQGRNLYGRYSEHLWKWLSYAALGGIILFMMWPDHNRSAFSWDASYGPLAFLLILGLALTPQTALGRFLSSRPLVILGEASFALYLVHANLIRIFGIERFLEFELWVAMPLWIAFGAICIALSISLNRYIETPLRHIITRWGNRLTKTRSTV